MRSNRADKLSGRGSNIGKTAAKKAGVLSDIPVEIINIRECSLKNKNAARQAIMAIITIPMIIGLFALRYPVVTILFKRGAFDDNSVKLTCDILAGYSLGILGQSIIVLCLRYYLAIKKIFKPLIILMFTFALNIILDLNLIKTIGLSGIGFGSAVSSTICGGLFIWDIFKSAVKGNYL